MNILIINRILICIIALLGLIAIGLYGYAAYLKSELDKRDEDNNPNTTEE